MVLPIALALMGASIARKGKDDELDAQDRADERAGRREDRDFQRSERQYVTGERARMATNRDRVAAAAAPVVPTDGTVYQPEVDDEGNPMLPNPTAGTFKVGDQRFPDRAAADTAAASENTGPKRTARMSTAMELGGDIAGAQALRTGARQEQTAAQQSRLADMQIDEAQRKFANAKFDESLAAITSFDALAGAISGMEGTAAGIKLQAQPSADGKTITLVQVKPDGATVATQKTFPNTERGLEEAKVSFAKGIGPHDKITYLHQRATEAQAAAALAQHASEGDKNRANALLLARTHEAGANSRASLAAGGNAPATPDSTFDRKMWTDIAKEQANADAKRAADDGKPMSPAAIAARADTILGAAFQAHSNRFNTGVLQRKLAEVKADPEAYAAVYSQAIKMVPPEQLAQMGFKPPGAGPAPAADQWIRSAPPGGAVRPGMPAPQAPQQGTPQMTQSTAGPQVPFLDFVAKNITMPGGKQQIALRAREELPVLQARINNLTNTLRLPLVKGAVRSKLQADLEASASEAEPMATFLAGNPGI